MFCPECQSEYCEGINRCCDCAVDLVFSLPEIADESVAELIPITELETVLTVGSQADLAVVKSILDGESIPFLAKGEGVQNLFGMGSLGTGYNVMTGPVAVQVNSPDVEKAKAVLKDFKAESGGE